MSLIGDIFNLLLLQPTINLIVGILIVLEALRLPGALGFAMIILTILIRLISWPFTSAQIRSMKKTAELKPHLEQLKKKHGEDKQALAQATMQLYKEHGVNPAGGCLTSIVPILLIFPLYQVILAFLDPKEGLSRINYFLYFKEWKLDKLPDASFLGFDLAAKPWDFLSQGYIMLLIPILAVVTQLVLSKMMYPSPVKKYPSDTPKEKVEKEKTQDAMEAMQSQMMFMVPIMIGYFSFTFPVGLSLYWIALNIVSIIQQYLVAGLGGLEDWIKKLKR